MCRARSNVWKGRPFRRRIPPITYLRVLPRPPMGFTHFTNWFTTMPYGPHGLFVSIPGSRPVASVRRHASWPRGLYHSTTSNITTYITEHTRPYTYQGFLSCTELYSALLSHR